MGTPDWVREGGVCVASVLFALELIYFLACWPELSGRRIRVSLITPRDVQRIVYLRVASARHSADVRDEQ